MNLIFPQVVAHASPNFSERSAPIDLITIHDCEGSYQGSVAVFLQQRGAQSVSAQLVLNDDGTEVTYMVPVTKKAWHACDFNSRSVGIEMAGFTAKGFAASELQADALIVAWLLRKLGIPCQDAQGGKYSGFTSHYALGAAGGGHSDPTTDPAVWAGYVARVTVAYEELGKAPLPEWINLASLGVVTQPAPPMPENFAPSNTIRSDEPAVVLPMWPPAAHPFFGWAGRAYNKWIALGASTRGAFGLVSNNEAECDFEVNAVGDNHSAFGLAQWHEPRITAILQGCGIDVRTEKSLEKQIEAMHWELVNKFATVWAATNAATTVAAAGQEVCTYFEMAGAANAAYRRGMMAERWLVYSVNNKDWLKNNPVQG